MIVNNYQTINAYQKWLLTQLRTGQMTVAEFVKLSKEHGDAARKETIPVRDLRDT